MDMAFDKYTSVLKDIFWQHITVGIVVGVVILIVMLFLSFTREEKIMWRIVLAFTEIVIVAATVLSVIPYGRDIYNGDYITYEGEYVVQDIVAEKGNGFFAIISLEDNQTVKLSIKACEEDLPVGRHNGKLVYFKNTKFLFDWD